MLDTVGDYIAEARVLLQDTNNAAYRTPDTELKAALGLGVLEIRRMRPDLLVFGAMPAITSATLDNVPVTLDAQFRLALLYFVVGQVGLKDEEEGAESRASGFMRSFVSKLLSVGA